MASTSVRLLKILGAAGVVGVAATGVLAARRERERRAVTPEEVRARLHERYAALPPEDVDVTSVPPATGDRRRAADVSTRLRTEAGRVRARLRGIPRRRRADG
ncbi:MAG: hypothetical protein LWW86_15560 [Micrococcales bacterium]|nr:hypothetical protein [Micrococcales bacterium]